MTVVHGLHKHPVYKVYRAMLNRCHREKDASWQYYGARGIKVCKRWRKNFVNFWVDMKGTYKRGLTLERKKNRLGYSKSNCYWATVLQQNRNRRNNKLIKSPWGRVPISVAAENAGLNYETLRERIRRKWSLERLFIPAAKREYKNR